MSAAHKKKFSPESLQTVCALEGVIAAQTQVLSLERAIGCECVGSL